MKSLEKSGSTGQDWDNIRAKSFEQRRALHIVAAGLEILNLNVVGFSYTRTIDITC